MFQPSRVLDDQKCFLFGKHKGKCIDDVLKTDENYLRWMKNLPWAQSDPVLMQKICNLGEATIGWGKHKTKSLSWILANDPHYIKWLKTNEYVATNCKDLKAKLDKINIED